MTDLCMMVTTKDIIRFWLPLSFTWLIMAVEGPTLTAIVARLDNATFNLAAYGLAFAFAMLVESPIVNLLSASVALAKDRAAAAKLQRFMIWLNIAITVVMILLCIPAVFKLLATDAIGLADDIAWRFHVGLMILTPWPAAIGYRRFYQGLLIRNNQTRKVANGTIVRLVSMATSASILALATNAEGIIVATVGLTTGVVCEALATRWMARGVIKLYRDQELDDCEPPPTDREIIRFYTPLALTSAVGFLSMPILSYFMNQAPQAVASLAVIPVVNAFIFLFRSFGFSFQEVGIAWLGQDVRSYPAVRRVGIGITIWTTVALMVVALTPILDVVFEVIFGLSSELTSFARIPTIIMIVMPLTSALFSLQRSIMIAAHRTIQVTVTMVLEVGLMILVMALCLALSDWTGAIAAAVSMGVARLIANVYAGIVSGRIKRRWGVS